MCTHYHAPVILQVKASAQDRHQNEVLRFVIIVHASMVYEFADDYTSFTYLNSQ